MPFKTKYLLLLTLLVLSGAVFAWTNTAKEFSNYFDAGGKLFQFQGCPITNPLLTPCVWGATAFLITFIWSVYNLKATGKKQILNLVRLKWFLVASTIFGWGNVAYDFYKYYAAQMQPIVSCTGIIKNPIYAPCFTGSIIFLASLIVSIILVRITSNEKKV